MINGRGGVDQVKLSQLKLFTPMVCDFQRQWQQLNGKKNTTEDTEENKTLFFKKASLKGHPWKHTYCSPLPHPLGSESLSGQVLPASKAPVLTVARDKPHKLTSAHLCLFLSVPVSYHAAGFQTIDVYLSSFRKLEVRNEADGRATLPLKARGGSFLPVLASGGVLGFPWYVTWAAGSAGSLTRCCTTRELPLLSLLTRTSAIGLGPTLSWNDRYLTNYVERTSFYIK